MKFLFIVIGFCLDRLATHKAIDTNIHTFHDFDTYIQSREKLDKTSFHKRLNYLKMLGLIVLFILLVETLICLTAEWQTATKSKAFTLAYGIPGIVILFLFSRDFIYELNVIDIHQPAAWNPITYLEKPGVLYYHWIGTLLFAPLLFISIVFIFSINTIANIQPSVFACIQYGAGFIFLAATLSAYGRLPMNFKGAAYAHHLNSGPSKWGPKNG